MADPIRNFRFRVEMDGITDAGFTEASGFDSTTDAIEYREGKDAAHVRKLPGLTKFGDITLKYGLTEDTRLFDWRQEIIDGDINRRTVYVDRARRARQRESPLAVRQRLAQQARSGRLQRQGQRRGDQHADHHL